MDDSWNAYSNQDIGISYEEAIRPGERRIIFTGPRRSGKSSIERVIFHKLSPHETLLLESTDGVDIQQIQNIDFLRFQTWDFGGDFDVTQGVMYKDQVISPEVILRGSCTMVYVIDAQENDFEDSLPKLIETIIAAHKINSQIHFEIFLHKVDSDVVSEENKNERQQLLQNYVSSELSDVQGEILVSYYVTSIYDHSALEAFSKVVQKLVYQLPLINSLLDRLVENCIIEKSFLLDIYSKLYIATDSSPVESKTYELCADLVELVIDTSCIYGLVELDGASIPFNSQSCSAITLSSNMVLYLREVCNSVALVCLVREENFSKRSLLDYNINCFRRSLEEVLKAGAALENANQDISD